MSTIGRWDIRACRLAVVVASAVAMIACAGCLASGSASSAGPVSAASGSAATPSPSPAASLRLDEHANGTTVHARPGQTIELVLHSSYWTALRSTAPDVVHQQAPTVARPGTCPPGVGCGTFSTTFQARKTGRTELRADRTSCGEALRCDPKQAHFAVVIVVG